MAAAETILRRLRFADDMFLAPRLLPKTKAAAYCSLSTSGFDDWRRKGLMPEPIPGTTRWDVKLLDKAIDKLSGLSEPESPQDAYDAWKKGSGR
jgi:hypothetical protein